MHLSARSLKFIFVTALATLAWPQVGVTAPIFSADFLQAALKKSPKKSKKISKKTGTKKSATSSNSSVLKRNQETAKELYESGVKLYNEHKFEEASSLFTAAYDLDPSPVLLWNLARSAEEQGDARNAISYYQSYLEAATDATEIVEVQRRIRVLEAVLRAVYPAVITIEDLPPDAEITFNGQEPGPMVAPSEWNFEAGELFLVVKSSQGRFEHHAILAQSERLELRFKPNHQQKRVILPAFKLVQNSINQVFLSNSNLNTPAQKKLSPSSEPLDETQFIAAEPQTSIEKHWRIAMFGTIGAAITTAAAGAYFYIIANNDNDSIEYARKNALKLTEEGFRSDAEIARMAQARDDRDSHAMLSRVFLSLAGASVIASGAIAIWAPRTSKSSLTFTPTFNGVALGLTF